MKDKGHFYISIIKSLIRLLSCIYLIFTFNFILFAYGFLVAEILGIAEEIFDKRGNDNNKTLREKMQEYKRVTGYDKMTKEERQASMYIGRKL